MGKDTNIFRTIATTKHACTKLWRSVNGCSLQLKGSNELKQVLFFGFHHQTRDLTKVQIYLISVKQTIFVKDNETDFHNVVT